MKPAAPAPAVAVQALAWVGSVAVGAASVVQSRINGEVGTVLGNGPLAAWWSFVVGLVIVSATVAVWPTQRRRAAHFARQCRDGRWKDLRLSPWHLLGGIGGATFVTAQAYSVPLVGVAVFTVVVVAGQNLSSLFVDRSGLGPAGPQSLSTRRVAAAGLATVGVALAVGGQGSARTIVVGALLLTVCAGLLVAVQQAVNARVGVASQTPWVAAVVNFAVGWLALSIIVIVTTVLTGGGRFAPPPPWEQPVLWLSGVIGVGFIVMAAVAVRVLGVLEFALAAIAGQVSGALLVDVVAPTAGTVVNVTVVIGTVIAGVAAALATVSQRVVRRVER